MAYGTEVTSSASSLQRADILKWTPGRLSDGKPTSSAADTLLQSIELAVSAGELGTDGAYFRIDHFARQLVSSFANRQREPTLN